MSRTEITTPEVLAEETVVELSLRPRRLAEFIGQRRVIESLDIAIRAALGRQEPLDHLLFHGPAGLGKTTLAELIAREVGANLYTASGPTLEKPGDLVATLTNLRAGDLLFIDEIHRLRPVIEEFLYPAMEDYKIDIRLSEGPKAQTITMPIEKFTLIGATTRHGMLTAPLRARFGLTMRMDFYPREEIEEVVRRTATVLNVEMDAGAVAEISRRSRGTPRVANRILRRVRDYAQVRADGTITTEVARDALRLLEVDEFGLDDLDVRMLRTIIEKFGGGPVGIQALAASIGEDSITLEEANEPFLVQSGLVNRTPRGRTATAAAYKHLGYKAPSPTGAQAQLF